MTWFLNSRIGRAILAVLSIIGAAALIWFRGRAVGQQSAEMGSQVKDLQNANQLNKEAAAADAAAAADTRPVDQQLRDLNALRD